MSYTKILIKGVIELKTGLHIGGDDSYSAIGAVNSPVVRDPLTREPIIPGSSLKGKLRFLLAREKDTTSDKEGTASSEKGATPTKEANGPDNDHPEVLRLFGSSASNSNAAKDGIQMSRLQFSDCFLNKDFLNKEQELLEVFETKFENSIDRLTSEANPRQIERVVRGAKFDFEIIYNVEDPNQIEEDFENIRTAFDLLEHDYLGGNGTRGYGRVEFEDLAAKVVTGDDTLEIPELR